MQPPIISKGDRLDLFNGISGDFDDSTHGFTDVDKPDRLAAIGGSQAALEYLWGNSGMLLRWLLKVNLGWCILDFHWKR